MTTLIIVHTMILTRRFLGKTEYGGGGEMSRAGGVSEGGVELASSGGVA